MSRRDGSVSPPRSLLAPTSPLDRGDSQASISSMLADIDDEQAPLQQTQTASKVSLTWFLAGGVLVILVVVMLVFDVIGMRKAQSDHLAMLTKNTSTLGKKHGKRSQYGSSPSNVNLSSDYETNPHHSWYQQYLAKQKGLPETNNNKEEVRRRQRRL